MMREIRPGVRGAVYAILSTTLMSACLDRTLPQSFPEDAADRYADVLCPAVDACGCGLFASVDDCRQQVLEEFALVEPTVREFDESCFDQFLASSIYETCGANLDWDLLPDCLVFQGSDSLGEPCQRYSVFGRMALQGTCAGDAFCNPWTGTCTNNHVLVPKSLGESCTDQLPSNCVDPDLYCHIDECQPRLPTGSECDHFDACEITDYCADLSESGLGICTDLIQPGEACSPDDFEPCIPTAESYAWCNPASLVCQAPIPYVCARFL